MELSAARSHAVATLIRAMARTTSQNAAYSHALAAQLGIGPSDLECLALLEELGPASAGQLADVLNLTTGAITGVVDRLEATGFVVRESDPADRRRVIVRPIQDRMADLDTAVEPLLQAASESFVSFTAADLDLLIDFQARAYALMQRQTADLKARQISPSAGSVFTAPLGRVEAGCLEFATGASELRIYAHDRPMDLYRATFDGPQPSVRVQDGSVVFRYRRMTPFDWGEHAGAVGLNPSIPWRIALNGGTSRVSVDALDLQLRELRVVGGASRVDVVLGAARGTVPVCVDGGLVQVQIQRPSEAPAQVQIYGGANRLEFDGQRFGAIGGDLRLASSGWEMATDRYAIEVRGGASRLDIHQV